MRPTHHRPAGRAGDPRARRLWLLVALVVLMMQTLALLHAVQHGPGRAGVQAAGHAQSAGAVERHAAGKLFAGHEAGSSSCAAFDQLLQPQMLHSLPCIALPDFAPPGPAEPHRAWHLALQALGFLARGPPAA